MKAQIVIILLVVLVGSSLLPIATESEDSSASLTITARPDADIYINNAYIGETPLEDISLEPGEYKLIAKPLEEYYEITKLKLILAKNEQRKIYLKLEVNRDIPKSYAFWTRPNVSNNSLVSIDSTVPETKVTLAMKSELAFDGITPVDSIEFKPGKYILESKAENYEDIRFDLKIAEGIIYDIDLYPKKTTSAINKHRLKYLGIVLGGAVLIAAITFMVITRTWEAN